MGLEIWGIFELNSQEWGEGSKDPSVRVGKGAEEILQQVLDRASRVFPDYLLNFFPADVNITCVAEAFFKKDRNLPFFST